jgi:hypothetical protein
MVSDAGDQDRRLRTGLPPYCGDMEDLAVAARAALVREIGLGGGWAADPRWRTAFEAVPRHLFVPYYYVGAAGVSTPIRRRGSAG